MSTRRRSHLAAYMGLAALLLAVLAAVPLNAMAQEDVHVFIAGPSILPTNTTVQYTISITGGPAAEDPENGTYSYIARLDMQSPVGALLEPQEAMSSNHIFTVNVTTPEFPQEMTLVVDGTSTTNITDINLTKSSGEVNKTIEVFKPFRVNISANVRNPGPAEVKGARVTFYVDGELIGNRTVDLWANTTEAVYLEWVAPPEEEGEHEVEVRINDDGSLLEFDTGDNVMRQTIYVGDIPKRPVHPIMFFSNAGMLFSMNFWAVLVTFGAFVMWWRTRRGRAYYTPAQTNIMYLLGIVNIMVSLPMFYVADVLYANPDATGDPWLTAFGATLLFALGLLTVLFTWDRHRRKKR